MRDGFTFTVNTRLGDARTGTLSTPHGEIQTPAFVTVGTKAAVKGITVEMLQDLGGQVLLANTYHLYFSPGDETIKQAGGLHAFSQWNGPMMTDSGGFQAFSLGAAFGTTVSKIADQDSGYTQTTKNENKNATAIITEEGVEFKSHKDGSTHLFTAEKSIGIQQNLGADMYFAFDECTSPQADYLYQKEAMIRTHRWAERSIAEHERLEALKTDRPPQAIFGVVQGGRHEDLRTQSASFLAGLPFDGFGIGGSFNRTDMDIAVRAACAALPTDKPRHLLGIGEPIDFFLGIENGIDLFDCVAPTRIARHGSLHTKDGKINIKAARYRNDFAPVEDDCTCYCCKNYTRAYICHLIREKEMLGATLATIHNLHFTINLVDNIRTSIDENNFAQYKTQFISRYYPNGSQ